jgi:signal transduction histidine kinase
LPPTLRTRWERAGCSLTDAPCLRAALWDAAHHHNPGRSDAKREAIRHPYATSRARDTLPIQFGKQRAESYLQETPVRNRASRPHAMKPPIVEARETKTRRDVDTQARLVVGLLLIEAVSIAALVPHAMPSAHGSARVAGVGVLALLVISEAVAVVAWWRKKSVLSPGAASMARPDQLPPSDETGVPEVVGASELLVSLARRNQALLYRQLARLDEMEAREQDAATLSDLFVVDHLATRMRRNAESLLILSGEESARRMSKPIAFSEAIRGAVAEIEDYERIDVTVQGEAELGGRAVVDVVHLLAELVENAASFSPPDSRVALHGARTRDGYVVTITDRGVGLDSAQVEHYNARLASYSDADDLEASSMLGFRVVRRLAARHDIAVRLVSQTDHGTVVTVEIPASLLVGSVAATPMVETPVPVTQRAESAEAADTQSAPAGFRIGAPRQYFPDGVVPPGYAAAPPAPLLPPASPEPARARAVDVPGEHLERVAPADLGLDPDLEFGLDTEPYAPGVADLSADVFSGTEPLEQRVPQGNLAPQMRGGPATPTLPSSSASVPEPEHARSLLAAYSNGLSLGRAAIPDHAGGAGDSVDDGSEDAR